MSPTPFDISVTVVMLAVTVALFMWFRRSEAVASMARMMEMMTRAGLEPGLAAHGEAGTTAILKEARHRCQACPVEGHCDRWLRGIVEGDNGFCPNATVFGALSKT